MCSALFKIAASNGPSVGVHFCRVRGSYKKKSRMLTFTTRGQTGKKEKPDKGLDTEKENI